MRVAHVTTVDMALRYLLLPQLKAVLEEGGEAIGISAPGPWVPELEAAGVRHLPLPSSTRRLNLVSDVKAAWELFQILRREDFDVIHTHTPKPGFYGRILGRLMGVPIVINTVHGLYGRPSGSVTKRTIVYTMEAIAARFSDAELVQGSEDLDFMVRWRITRPRRTRLLGNGVDLRRFDPATCPPESREDLRSRLGIHDRHIVVGMVGRLVAEKGYPELFTAASLLDDRYVILAIGPEDPEKPDALPSEVRRDAERNGVRFLGMRTDMVALYNSMDVFVLPSHREGFPRAAMEAAAMGLPIVATQVSGCREVVRDGVNGFLVPLKDPHALAGAIRTLGDDPNLRDAMGRASHARAREKFDERTVVEIVMETYREVARGKGLVPSSPPQPAATRSAQPSNTAEQRDEE